MPDLAVILVNWNTCQLTLDALRTLFDDLTGLDAAVWVVDNASEDGSVDAIHTAFPQVNLIASEHNLGFGAGNNLAMRSMGFGEQNPASLPRAVYLLNTDTITHPGATKTLYGALFSLPEAGVVGARLTYEDGRFQHSAFAFPGLIQLWIDLMPAPARLYDSRLNGRYPRRLYHAQKPFTVGHTLGATMMIRREVIQQTGMFDEQFVMYVEEVEWSWRIQDAGWKIYCVPAAHVTHLEGQSTKKARPQSILNLWKGRLLLYDRRYDRWKSWLARRIIQAGMKRAIRRIQADPAHTIDERAALVEACRSVIDLAAQ